MKEEIVQVPIDRINIGDPQVREVFDDLTGFAKNIEEVGQLLPVLLFPVGDRFGITDGERRCRALKLLGKKTVNAIIGEKPSEAELLLKQLSCDLQRVDLSPIEKATAIDRAMTANNLKGNQIAVTLGVSPAMVSRLVALLTLPEPIKLAIREGKITASAGYELSKMDAVLRDEIAQKLMEGKMTRDEVMGARKRKPETGEKPKRVTACLEGGRTITVSAGTLDDFIAALEECLSKARKGRTQGVALTTFIRLLKDQAA